MSSHLQKKHKHKMERGGAEYVYMMTCQKGQEYSSFMLPQWQQ